MKTRTNLLAPILLTTLALAACGGSDILSESNAADEPGADVLDRALGNEGAAGSNDELQANLDELGVDVDLSELEDSLSALNTGDGGGVITIDGGAYEFIGEFCFAYGDGISIEGPGVGPAGEPIWGSISVTTTTRADMEGTGLVEDDSILDTMFGDKDAVTDVEVGIEFGRTDAYGDGDDDKPNYEASIIFDDAWMGSIDYVVDGDTVSGSGTMGDSNYVALEFGDTVPFEFTGGCG